MTSNDWFRNVDLLRNYYAGKALQGLLTQMNAGQAANLSEEDTKRIAQQAFSIAHEMVVAAKGEHTPDQMV